jgi:hypothetical protein
MLHRIVITVTKAQEHRSTHRARAHGLLGCGKASVHNQRILIILVRWVGMRLLRKMTVQGACA